MITALLESNMTFSQLGFSFFKKKCKKNHYIYDFKEVFKNQ